MARSLGSRYVLHQPIGRGSMGQVWRATVVPDGTEVAVKVLRPELARDPDVVSRFARERDVLLAQDHPNLVRVRDLVADGDDLAIVMELVDGPDLRQLLGSAPGGTLAPSVALRLAAQVAEGLAAAHAANVVHRDLKPENVLVDRSDAAHPVALVSDAGVAQVATAPVLTRLTSVFGTPEYLAPDLIEGRPPTPAGDLYSLGVVLYELLFGRTPFASPSPAEVLEGHRLRPPPHPAGVPVPLWEVLASLLAKSPSDRPPSAAATARLLAGLADQTAGLAPFPALPPPPPLPPAPAAPAARGGATRGTPDRHGPRRVRERRTGGRRAALVLPLVALVAAAAVAARSGGTGGSEDASRVEAAAGTPSYAFAPVRFDGGLVVGRTWSLTGAAADRFEGVVRLTNTGAAPVPAGVHEELLPEALGRGVSFEPAPLEVVAAEHLVRWTVAPLAPGDTAELRYEADVAGGGDPVDRLRRWADGWAVAGGERRAGARLASLTLAPGAVELEAGRRLPLRLRGTLSDGTPALPVMLASVAWSSADPAVVRVDFGTLHALAAGATEIVAQAGDVAARVPVRVVAGPPPSALAAPGPTSTRPRRSPAPATTAPPATAAPTTLPAVISTSPPSTAPASTAPPTTARPTTTVPLPPPPRPQTVGVYFFSGAGAGWHLRRTNTSGVADLFVPPAEAGSFPLAGDWNGDGVDTIGWFHLPTGVFNLRNANTGGPPDLRFPFGGANSFPVVGDWNGDGVDTVGVFDTASGQWFLRNANSAGPADLVIPYGAANASFPVPGDWNGDGVDTIGVFYPASGVWDLRNSNSPGPPDVRFPYGATTDVHPVAGDWNGDGVDTVGAFYKGPARWDLRNSNTAGNPDLSFLYGAPGAFALVGTWVR